MSDPGVFSKTNMITVLTPSGTDRKELESRKQFGKVIKMKNEEMG